MQEPRFAETAAEARPIHVVSAQALPEWTATRPDHWQRWLTATGFKAGSGQVALLPDRDGACVAAVVGTGSDAEQARTRFIVAQAVAGLPEGAWQLHGTDDPDAAAEAALGWLLAGYRYSLRSDADATPCGARLVAPRGVDAARLEAIAAGEWLTRDLINTPASDMGPAELESAARALAARFDATCDVIAGDALDAGFPLISTVGRAPARRWA